MRKRKIIILLSVLVVAMCLWPLNISAQEKSVATLIRERTKIDWQQFAGTTVRALYEKCSATDGFNMYIPDFEKLTGMRVEVELIPEENLLQKVLMDLSTGAGMYDSIPVYGVETFLKCANAEWIVPVDQYLQDPSLTDRAWLDLDDYVRDFMEGTKYEGHIYGLPHWGEWAPVLYYRMDLFLKYGVKVPTSRDELWDAAKKLTLDLDGDKRTDIYGVIARGCRGSLGAMYMWPAFLRGFGGKWFAGGSPTKGITPDAPKGKQNWMPTINSPEAIAATDYFAGILRNFGPPDIGNYFHHEVIVTMTEGKAAMTVGSGFLGNVLNDPTISKVAGKIGFADLKFLHIHPWYVFVGINAASRHKKATWLWNQFVSSKEVIAGAATGVVGEWYVGTARNSVTNNPEFMKRFDIPSPTGSYLEIMESLKKRSDVDSRPRIPEYEEIACRIAIAISEVMTGEKTAEQALDEAQKDVTKTMEEAGYF